MIFLGLSNYTQQGANLGRRIKLSLVALIATLTLFIVSTQLKQINSTQVLLDCFGIHLPFAHTSSRAHTCRLFFIILICSTIVLAASASYLQGAATALAAIFGPDFLAQIISGQGAIGVAVAAIQFVSAYAAVKSSSSLSPDTPSLQFQTASAAASGAQDLAALAAGPTPDKDIRDSAFHFFLAVGAVSAFGYVAFEVMSRLEVYKLVKRSEKESAEEEEPSVRAAERKIRHLGIAVLIVFAVTLSVFPGVTSSILSANTDGQARGPAWLQLPQTLSQPALFIPLVFGIFACGDWLGRLLPQIQALVFTDWRVLMAAAVLRVLFIVSLKLGWVCHRERSHTDPHHPRSPLSCCATSAPHTKALCPTSTRMRVSQSHFPENLLAMLTCRPTSQCSCS